MLLASRNRRVPRVLSVVREMFVVGSGSEFQSCKFLKQDTAQRYIPDRELHSRTNGRNVRLDRHPWDEHKKHVTVSRSLTRSFYPCLCLCVAVFLSPPQCLCVSLRLSVYVCVSLCLVLLAVGNELQRSDRFLYRRNKKN